MIAYSVSQRTGEIGVRMAFGAEHGSIYRMVLREAGWLAAAGIAFGAAGSVAAATLARKLLFGVSWWDAQTLVVVGVVLGRCVVGEFGAGAACRIGRPDGCAADRVVPSSKDSGKRCLALQDFLGDAPH